MESINLLNELYKNTQMATYAIDLVAPAIHEAEFKKVVNKQNAIYRDYNTKILNLCNNLNCKPKKLCGTAKVMSSISIKSKLMCNKKSNHIASMLAKGTQMGIDNTSIAVTNNPNATNEIKELANEIIKSQNEFLKSINKIFWIW